MLLNCDIFKSILDDVCGGKKRMSVLVLLFFVWILFSYTDGLIVEYNDTPTDIMDPSCFEIENSFCGCDGNNLLIGLYKIANGTSLDYIDGFRCATPNGINVDACHDIDVSIPFREEGNITCPDGKFVQSLHVQSSQNTLLNIRYMKCCSSLFTTFGGRDVSSSYVNNGIWGESCLGYDKQGWCGIGNNAFITGFRRILNNSISSSSEKHGINNIIEVYYKTLHFQSTTSNKPTNIPSKYPTNNPTNYPTEFMIHNNNSITNTPSIIPSNLPSNVPSISPTKMPTQIPSKNTTITPLPSESPTFTPFQNQTTFLPLPDKINKSKLDKTILLMILVGSAVILMLILIVFVLVCVLIRKRNSDQNQVFNSSNKNESNIPGSIQIEPITVASQSNISSHEITSHTIPKTMESLYDQPSDMEGFNETPNNTLFPLQTNDV